MKSEILELIEEIYPDIRELRQQLHRNPELAFEEIRTADLLKDKLSNLDLKIGKTIAKTGFTALLKGNSKDRVAAYRADMDALPIEEKTGLPFASEIPGKMHACGHDSHMAMAVGVARILSKLRNHFDGSVKFIFQPAEEVPPGGARLMVAEGALKKPDVDAIFGLHVDPSFKSGRVAVKDGVMLSGVNDLNIVIYGKGGHAAKPHSCIDAIAAASEVVQKLQTVVSRSIDPLEPVVITIGKIEGGTVRNVIADTVKLEGTIRGLKKKTLMTLRKEINRSVSNVARAYGARAEVEFVDGYPPLKNSPAVNSIIRRTVRELYGAGSLLELDTPLMAAEDFAFYLDSVPGAMYRLGVGNKTVGSVYPWHHNKFTIDEEAMKTGMAVSALAIMNFLKGRS